MRIGLASPPIPHSLDEGLQLLEELAAEGAAKGAEIICFPESFLPGYPGMGYSPSDRDAARLREALKLVQSVAAKNNAALVVPMDWPENDELFNVAMVVNAQGEVLGWQTKNQLDPSEDYEWTPGTERHLFTVGALTFGIVICHEGFRYPESVRWAAQRGAALVFHPHFGGSNEEGTTPSEWGHKDNPYYEKAMMMRSIENTIFFASVNYASRFPDSATSLIGPDGQCIAHQPYAQPGVLVVDIDPAQGTGFLASRFKKELFV